MTASAAWAALALGTIFEGAALEALASAFSGVAATVGWLNPEPAHLVGAGGAIGAILRHWVYLRVTWEEFPAATLIVNVIGSFVFGAAVFAGAGESTIQLLGIGICGSFTTFSSFSVETVQLWERGDRKLAVASAAANLLVSLAAIGLAWLLVGLV